MSDHPGEARAPGGLPKYVGRYRVLERIGRGAMGIVYSAIDEQLDRRVAVKLMLADFDEAPDMRERFYREARITGQLAHRNIITVFDLGDERGRPFIVMELLEGLPLAEHLQMGGSPALDDKLDLMMQVCDGLQNAHRCGVIHRDLKPSNLFIQRDGSVKILDFGVARMTASNLTASGFLVGTPEYMPPEQPQGRPVDARSDVYSAASVFYFMLTGRSPFGSRDLLKMLDAILYETPPPIGDDQAPEAVRRVLMRGLAKAPNDRYQQCAEMMEDLARVRSGLKGVAQRVVLAARERYRDILTIIEERRALGRALGMAGIDQSCDADLARLQQRFRHFAPTTAPQGDQIDRAVAQAALEALQLRHNAERAALAAMREQAAARTAPSRAESGGMSRFVAFWRSRFGRGNARS
jgi:tRNA A-37 threonylcarbamoyl transferase component Bud32